MIEPTRYQNCLTVDGDKSSLFQVQVLLMSDNNLFDFNKLLPTPQKLRGVVVGRTWIEGRQETEWMECDGEPQPLPEGFRKLMLERFGATNWREWREANWGCIWPPENVCLYKPKKNRLLYRFETDGIATGVVNAFSNRFGNLAFSWMVSGEDTARTFTNYERSLETAEAD